MSVFREKQTYALLVFKITFVNDHLLFVLQKEYTPEFGAIVTGKIVELRFVFNSRFLIPSILFLITEYQL